MNSTGIGSGLFALLTGFFILVPEHFFPSILTHYMFLSIYLGVGLGTFLLLMVNPDFMKPEWVRWLEKEHKPLISNIHSRISQFGCKKWEKQVKSDEELKQWVENLAQSQLSYYSGISKKKTTVIGLSHTP